VPALCILFTQAAAATGMIDMPSMHFVAEDGWKLVKHTVSATKQFAGGTMLSVVQQFFLMGV